MTPLTPTQIRNSVLKFCDAWASARATNNELIMQATSTYIQDVLLPKLIPDNTEPPEAESSV